VSSIPLSQKNRKNFSVSADLQIESTPSVQRIGIIGAGAAGLAALKIILDTPQFKDGSWIPVAYEAREQVGGVWQVSMLEVVLSF
jgi:cation diffusion facilitator CzcD-associated flavoprotein CzcO